MPGTDGDQLDTAEQDEVPPVPRRGLSANLLAALGIDALPSDGVVGADQSPPASLPPATA
jgi:hypothetical protein